MKLYELFLIDFNMHNNICIFKKFTSNVSGLRTTRFAISIHWKSNMVSGSSGRRFIAGPTKNQSIYFETIKTIYGYFRFLISCLQKSIQCVKHNTIYYICLLISTKKKQWLSLLQFILYDVFKKKLLLIHYIYK